MKKIIFTFMLLALSLYAYNQTDTIYSNNEKIPCSVKEITPDAVKFCYPGEDLVNTLYKNAIQKIVFKSGRVQVFAEATSFKSVNSVEDFDNVTLTQVESEVKGLFKLGELGAKAKGTTSLSNQERVKERAYRKLKIIAAMMGANAVYLTFARSEGNKVTGGYVDGQGIYHSTTQSAETSVSGVAYTNHLPNYQDFVNLKGNRNQFSSLGEVRLESSGSDMSKTDKSRRFQISGVKNENGLIMLTGELQGEKKINNFRVVSFDRSGFCIYYKDKETSYNIQFGF
jgi:hypothetical protein